MSYEVLKLENQVCFALYACAKEVTKSYKPFLDKLGITYTQYITLLVLWEQDQITVKELGKKLRLDSGTLTPLLKKLETIGYIKRIRDTKDERNVFIELTEKGKELKDQAVEIPYQLLCSVGIPQQELLDLKKKLDFLLEIMDQSPIG